MPSAAADGSVARFQGDIAALIGDEGRASARLGIAVSGGPDSMAMLWLAACAFPGRVCSATVDHGLRTESREEAEMVAAWCADAGVPHAILSPTTRISGSIQASARETRYDLLESWRTAKNVDWLLTAHHADDQLETLLMRLNRASGVGGLAGIRARNGVVLRPLLGWRRHELMDIVVEQALPHVHDPSNEDRRFDRAAMRSHLAGVDWLDPIAAARSASACADADAALQWMVSELARAHVHKGPDGGIRLDRNDFPRELQRRLLVRMLATAEPAAPEPRGDTVDQAVVQLLRGKRVTIGRWLLSGGDTWTLCLAPPRKAR